MKSTKHIHRRSVLGLLGSASAMQMLRSGAGAGALLSVGAGTQAAVPTDVITVMYQRESDAAPSRVEPVTQAAILGLQREFLKRKLRVLQPNPEIYQLLDQGQGVVITFATDAGFSLLFSMHAEMRPAPGQDAGIAEVRLSTRVFVGRSVLAADEGRGQMLARLDPAVRDAATRRAMELAAGRAAADVAEKVASQLQDLTPEKINEMVGAHSSSTTTSFVVPLPASAAPTGGVVAPPGLPADAALPPSAAPAAPLPGPSAVLSEPKNRYALVVGMSDYGMVRDANRGYGIKDLKGVAKDVDLVVDSLLKLGYTREHMTVLRDRQATSAAVRGAIKALAGKVQPDDSVVIFVAGHGADKNESASGFGMPVLADYRPKDPQSLDFFELQSYIKNLRGRVVWVSDTCHSGGAASNVTSVVVSSRGVTAKTDVRGPDAGAVAANSTPGQDFAILTACQPSELSLETAEGGIFTTRLFQQLVSNKNQLPLGRLFAETVATQVIEKSRPICNPTSFCNGHSQQTPVMAYSGRGAAFRL